LFDAYTGSVRCSYRAYDAVDAIESAYSVTFSPDGQRVVAGYNRYIKVFHTDIAGRDYDTFRLGKSRYSKDGQKGIVSDISFRSDGNVFAVGTYAGSIYLYDDRMPSAIAADIVIHGTCVVGHGKSGRARKRRFHEEEDGAVQDVCFASAKSKIFEKTVSGGITQLKWTDDHNYLFSAARRSDYVVSWDMRRLTGQEDVAIKGVKSYARRAGTNQRIDFDFHQNKIYVGSCDSKVKIYDINSGRCDGVVDCEDLVNGVSCCSSYDVLYIATGTRRFDIDIGEDDCDDSNPATSLESIAPGSLEAYKI